MIKTEQHILLKAYQTNTWMVYDDESKEALLIDPAYPDQSLADHIQKMQLRIVMIINTHGHADHIGGNDFFAQLFAAPIAIHNDDAIMLVNAKKNLSAYMDMPITGSAAAVMLKDQDSISMGAYSFHVIHTPGHTPGSICLHSGAYLFSGDTLFEQSIGRTDLPGGNHQAIITSIKEKLYRLPDNTIVFPGHGPKTNIGIEKQINPFVR